MRKRMAQALPIVIGHEVAGEVVAVGERVTNPKPGTRVVVEPNLPCWECSFCIKGATNLCRQRKGIVGVTTNGGMAEYAVVPASNVFPVPENIADAEAPLLETLGVGVHAMERAPIFPGESVAVVGAGPVGLLLLQALKAAGASPVIVTGSARSRGRLQLAKSLGADEVAVSGDAVVERVKAVTGGLGVHTAFECAGTPLAITQAVAMTRPGGRVCIAGSSESISRIRSWSMIKTPEIAVIGSHGRLLSTWPRILSLAGGGKIRLRSLISHTVRLNQAVDAIGRIREDRSIVKVIVEI